MIKRDDFKQIIKIRSIWSLNGNWQLPNGQMLNDYVYDLVISQLKLDNLGISKTGDIVYYDKQSNALFKFFNKSHFLENTFYIQQKKRAKKLANEIVEDK